MDGDGIHGMAQVTVLVIALIITVLMVTDGMAIIGTETTGTAMATTTALTTIAAVIEVHDTAVQHLIIIIPIMEEEAIPTIIMAQEKIMETGQEPL